jgi:oligoribonuclease NrnB/cAMP/cGMP phosphodiesterase (DHH superfamily)
MKYVLYHGGCNDGFTAAWVAHRLFGDAEAVYRPMAYGAEVPLEIRPWDQVYLLDYSFRAAGMTQLLERAARVTVIDHHQSALEEFDRMAANPGLELHLDLGRSGAGLTWDTLFPWNPRPALVQYVEDRDLWHFRLPASREIHQFVSGHPHTFEAWDAIEQILESPLGLSLATQEGAACLRLMAQQVDRMVKGAVLRVILGHAVPVVNATCFQSEVGHAMDEAFPLAAFSASYREEGTIRTWSLRSGPEGQDVAKIAQTFGGGGHPHAAGWTEPQYVGLPALADPDV